MKRCPECRRDYYDESLFYCLDDGSALLEGPASFDGPPTEVLHSTAPPAETATRQQITQTDPTAVLASGEFTKTESQLNRRKYALFIAIAVAFIAGAGLAYYKFAGGESANISFDGAKFTRSTSSGNVLNTAISPDGKWLVYSNINGQQQSLWLQQVAVAGSSSQIVPPADVRYLGLAFSPDGNYVYYNAADIGVLTGALYQVPVLGGTARKLFTGIVGKVSFSPDGKRITYFDYVGDEDRLMIANADGSDQRMLAARSGRELFYVGEFSSPSWSPDGKTIATTIGTNEPRRMTVATISPENGEITLFNTRDFTWVEELAWLADGKSVLVLAGETEGENLKVWQIPYPSGEAKKISNDLNTYLTISLTRDSNILASVRGDGTSNIWTAPLADTPHASQVTQGSDQNHSPSWTPDGKMVFVKRSGDAADIYIIDSGEGVPKQLTVNSGTNNNPAVSPDGRTIVFVSDRTGQSRLWRMNLDGSDQKQLTDTSAYDPSFSPDGREVIYESVGDNIWAIWKVGIEGGPPVRLTNKFSQRPRFSPDGKQFLCIYQEDPKSPHRITIFAADGGPPLKSLPLPNGLSGDLRWMPDGRSLIYSINKGGVSNLWTQSIDGGPLKQITNFTSDRIYSIDLSTDGRIAMSRGTQTNDVVLISGFKK